MFVWSLASSGKICAQTDAQPVLLRDDHDKQTLKSSGNRPLNEMRKRNLPQIFGKPAGAEHFAG